MNEYDIPLAKRNMLSVYQDKALALVTVFEFVFLVKVGFFASPIHRAHNMRIEREGEKVFAIVVLFVADIHRFSPVLAR